MGIEILRVLSTASFSCMVHKKAIQWKLLKLYPSLCVTRASVLCIFVSGFFFPVLVVKRNLWKVSDNEYQLTDMRSKEKVLSVYAFCFRM